MILPNMILLERVNERCLFSGIDSHRRCLDKNHFANFPYPVSYSFNNRGFRDAEWPIEKHALKNSIWCLGDSFTVGIGSPYDHIWPQQLEKKSGIRTINVSMDGASNDWITENAIEILDQLRPNRMVIMWSYLHRRQNPNKSLSTLARRIFANKEDSYKTDVENFINNVNKVESLKKDTTVVHLIIPDYFVGSKKDVFKIWKDISDLSWPVAPITDSEMEMLPNCIKQEMHDVHHCLELYDSLRRLHTLEGLIEIPRLDWARDKHHFDLMTSQWISRQVFPLLKI